ncbi:AB1gp21 [Acinetobacter phage AB1]|uniref:AB1gp21 n=1 Tax=Acinetobacter phage AB1 TaxID=889876 RepID=E2GLV9_9CAUD|nr:AB1gp21 [Acinetobacter phage AB1]ADO14392.1 AB1gp21 [Acinetobacter phage AB1]
MKAFEEELTSSRNYGDELQKRVDNLSVLICGDVIDILSCVEGHGDNSQLIEELEQALKGESND